MTADGGSASGFTDADGRPVAVPAPPPPDGSHYAAIGAFQASGYRRNAFARYTAQEVGVLSRVLGLDPGQSVLDVGCGTGRHVAALRQLGYDAVGLDLSPEVLAGRSRAPAEGHEAAGSLSGYLVAGRAQALPFDGDRFDGLISVCQGGFGIAPTQDRRALAEWARVLRPGGRLVLTAFSLVFAARFMDPGDAIDVTRGLHHHRAEVVGPDAERRTYDLWTVAYSVPHLSDLLGGHGFRMLGAAGAEPGGYTATRPPATTDPEILVWATLG